MVLFFFFFSSRRRHTMCYRDWSSDVCSSDLDTVDRYSESTSDVGSDEGPVGASEPRDQIGRASCRERVEISVDAGSVKKKSNWNIEVEAVDQINENSVMPEKMRRDVK